MMFLSMSLIIRQLIRNQYRNCLQCCFQSHFHTTPCLNQTYTEDSFSVEDKNVDRYLQSLRQEFYNLKTNTNLGSAGFRRIQQLSEVVSSFEQRSSVLKNISSLGDIENENDPEMKELIKEEKEVYSNILAKVNSDLMKQLLNLDTSEQYSSLFFEITAGVGGQEAMLFASDLFDMYTRYFSFKGWQYELVHSDQSDIGGLRHATVLIEDVNAYSFLKFEGGVHRVQRVPATEKSGRIHTSTVSIAVIPRPDDIDMVINDKDLKIETKRASGAGGQHVNTTDSAVRIVHIPTGVAVECQTERSQVKNKEIAINKLQAKLLEQKLQSQEASTNATRKSQVGSSNRNEKIRTYNFIQDRITDHRIKGGTLHNLDGFLEGREPLDGLINQLLIAERKSNLVNAINEMTKES